MNSGWKRALEENGKVAAGLQPGPGPANPSALPLQRLRRAGTLLLLAALLLPPALFADGRSISKACFDAAGSALDRLPDHFLLCEGVQSFRKGFDSHALDLFRRAAKWGSKDAQYRVGLMLAGGIGTEADPVEGAAWLLLANERNADRVTDRLRQLMERLSPEQQALAHETASKLRMEYGDYRALERRSEWVRWKKRRITGSHLGMPMATIRYFGSSLTGDQNLALLERYESSLRQLLTTVEYRDFEIVAEQGKEP